MQNNPRLTIEDKKYNNIDFNQCICDTREETVNKLEQLMPNFKCGYGGSHVWISTNDNKRIAIIEFRENNKFGRNKK